MTNENKFTGKSGIYAKFRPTYPSSLLGFLGRFVETGMVVADIGAGTGIFSKCLVNEGYQVIGVEPNDDMRKVAEEQLSYHSNFKSSTGTAEETGIDDSSVDFVTVAQAFHWFDELRFKKECQRILKPGGKVALIWNSREESTELVKEYKTINQRFCPGFKGFSEGINQAKIVNFFKDANYQIETFPNATTCTLEEFVGRALSSSYAPNQNDANFENYVSAIKALFTKYQQKGSLEFPYETIIYIGEV